MRLAVFFALSAVAGAVVLACNDDGADTPDAVDASSDAAPSHPSNDEDAAASGTDAGTDVATGNPEDGPGEAGAECAFNHDCALAFRCSCTEQTGCACTAGARGTGKNGIDDCDSGDQCASSLCVEGPTAGESVCSSSCKNEKDCTGKLPRCIAVAGLPESICARQP